RIFREQQKRPRGEVLEDWAAFGCVQNTCWGGPAKSPDPGECFVEPDFLRSYRPDRSVDPVFGCADPDAVKLAELEYRHKFVETHTRNPHSCLGNWQISARRESQQAESCDQEASHSGANSEEAEWY